MRRHILFFFIFFIFLLSQIEGNCWESDTHYGLTKWLAVKAGLSLKDAEIVAAGAESADESNVLKASVIVPTYVCIWNSQEASRHVQQHHFPSDGFVPSPKIQRRTIPGFPTNLNGGNLWVRQVINVKSKGKHHSANLNHFGQSLHPLADSWSHQGIPDKPPIICRDNLVWAHSKERGGWGSHDADITHKYVDDTIDMAEAVYHYMGEFLKHYPKYRNKSPKPWANLKNHVVKFAKAKTALEKKAWFDSNHDVPHESYTTYPCFLRDTSLEDHHKICPQEESQKEIRDSQIEGLILKGNREIREASEFIDNFLTNWIIKGNVDNVIKESFNIADVRKGLIESYPEWADVNVNLWFRTMLSMWFVPDHGLVNELGHGMPFPNKKGFEMLSYRVGKEWKKPYFKHLSEAIHFPGTQQPYQIITLPPDRHGLRVATVFRFNHTPRDTLIFISSKINGRFMITGMSWIII